MQYYQAGAGDFRSLTVRLLAHRYQVFAEIRREEIKFQAALAGAKLKGF